MKTSIGKGKFHLIFKSAKNFIKALALSYLGEPKKRCWALVSDKDNLVIVQPSVSTPGLNVLILEAEMIEKDEISKIKDLLVKEGIAIIIADYLRRSSQAQGFTVGFKKIDAFIKALNLFYSTGKRCRVIVPKIGPLVIQPSVSTPELNTLLLEGFSSVVGEEKKQIEVIINSLEMIECDMIISPLKTTNF